MKLRQTQSKNKSFQSNSTEASQFKGTTNLGQKKGCRSDLQPFLLVSPRGFEPLLPP